MALMIFPLTTFCERNSFFEYLLEKDSKECVVGKINKRKKLLSLSGLADEGRVCVVPFTFVLVFFLFKSERKKKFFIDCTFFRTKPHIRKVFFKL